MHSIAELKRSCSDPVCCSVGQCMSISALWVIAWAFQLCGWMHDISVLWVSAWAFRSCVSCTLPQNRNARALTELHTVAVCFSERRPCVLYFSHRMLRRICCNLSDHLLAFTCSYPIRPRSRIRCTILYCISQSLSKVCSDFVLLNKCTV